MSATEESSDSTGDQLVAIMGFLVLCLAAFSATTSSGEDLGRLLMELVPFGVACMLILVDTAPRWSRPTLGHVEQKGDKRPAILFVGRPNNEWASIAVAVCFFVMGLGLILFPTSVRRVSPEAIQFLGALILVAMLVFAVRDLSRLGLNDSWAFTSFGVTAEKGRVAETAAWADVEWAGFYRREAGYKGVAIAKFDVFGVRVAETASIERVSGKVQSRTAGQPSSEGVHLHGSAPTGEEGQQLEQLAQRLIADPKTRRQLGRAKSVERILW